MTLRRTLRQVHLWAGLALSLLLLVLAATGSALVYKDAYWRLVHPELRGGPSSLAAEDHAAAAAAARTAFGDALRSVKLPEPGVGTYHLYLADGEAFMSADDHRVIDRWRPTERPMALLFDLHAHLMAGEGGERVGGVVGLLGALMVLTGVYLWWPARKRFRPRTLLPRELSRRGLLPGHRDLGVLASPLLLVLLLTGSGMVFHDAAGVLLNGLFGDRPPPAEAESTSTSPGSNLPADAAFAAVARAFPDARVVFYYPPDASPDPATAPHGFRLKRPCEVHPNGRSSVYVDGDGRILQRIDACAALPGQKAVHAVYPLHAGKLDSALYRFAVFLGGAALAVVSATGAGAYLTHLRRP